jgi:hypothetical protein
MINAADPWRQAQLARYEREVEVLVAEADGRPRQESWFFRLLASSSIAEPIHGFVCTF